MKSIPTLSTLVLAAAAGSVSAQTNSTTFPDVAVDLLGPSSLQIGRSDRYILKVTNAGSALATNAAAVVSLPPGLGLYRSTPPSGCSYSTTQRKLSCTIAQIAVGATSTLRIDLKSIGAGPSTEASSGHGQRRAASRSAISSTTPTPCRPASAASHPS